MENSMKMSLNRLSRFPLALAGVATASALALAGCAGLTTTAVDTPVVEGAALTGHLHGGNQPVSGSVVKLYAAGSTGYGSAGTLLATTTTANDGYGSFKFSQVTTGATGPNGNSYVCPTTTSMLYLIANGGNTGGGANTSASFLAAVGACGTSAHSFIDMNEITTVASVYALAPYINPGTTPASESIGTSATAQGATGLSNAFGSVANLASIGNGTIPVPPTYPGTGTAAGITVTATVNSAKLNTVADILAACVNTTTGSSACSDLFNNALPPASASTTSEPSATFQTPQDTVQAAYYLAVNSGANGTPGACTTMATTAIGCLFNLVGTTPPFQTPLAAAPTDWTIGVVYTAAGTCATGGSFISGPYHGAVDAAGNIWFVNAPTAAANLSEMSSVGQPMFCGGDLASGRGVTIDANGNVWASFNGTATNGVMEVPSGTGTPTYWSVAAGTATYPVTSDGFGNVFVNVNALGGQVWEWVNPDPNHNATPYGATLLNTTGLNGTGATTLGYTQMDPTGRLWVTTSTVDKLYEFYPNSSYQATITGVAVTPGSATFTAVNSFTPGQTVQISGLTSAAGVAFNFGTYTIATATASSFTVSSTANSGTGVETSGMATIPANYTTAALTTTEPAYGMAIDSSNYLYQGTTCCGSGGTYRAAIKWTPGTAGTATNTYSATNFGGINGVRSVAVDGAANVWLGNELPSSAGATISAGSYAVMELATSGSGASVTFTALSPPGVAPTTCSTSAGCPTGGGYYDPSFTAEPYDLDVDPSGNLWVMNTYLYNVTANTAPSITELVGAAVPVSTPFSVAMRSGTLNAKP
jgi:hypothetical protein